MDFVGRLNGAPRTAISPDQVQRWSPGSRRGWDGVYVTAGIFSKIAQIEVIDDQYPLVPLTSAFHGGRDLGCVASR